MFLFSYIKKQDRFYFVFWVPFEKDYMSCLSSKQMFVSISQQHGSSAWPVPWQNSSEPGPAPAGSSPAGRFSLGTPWLHLRTSPALEK